MTNEDEPMTIGELFGSLWEAFLSISVIHLGMAIGGVLTFLVAAAISGVGDELENAASRVVLQTIAIAVGVIGAGLVVTGVLGMFWPDVLQL